MFDEALDSGGDLSYTVKTSACRANTSPPSTRARARGRGGSENQRPWPADKVERWSIDRLSLLGKSKAVAGGGRTVVDRSAVAGFAEFVKAGAQQP